MVAGHSGEEQEASPLHWEPVIVISLVGKTGGTMFVLPSLPSSPSPAESPTPWGAGSQLMEQGDCLGSLEGQTLLCTPPSPPGGDTGLAGPSHTHE